MQVPNRSQISFAFRKDQCEDEKYREKRKVLVCLKYMAAHTRCMCLSIAQMSSVETKTKTLELDPASTCGASQSLSRIHNDDYVTSSREDTVQADRKILSMVTGVCVNC